MTILERTRVISLRTHWQTLSLLDTLSQLEGKSRNRIINKAVWQYALDYLGARGHTVPGYLWTRLRRIQILQKRIELNIDAKGNLVLGNLDQGRQEMLEEAYRYARYTRNQASTMLLSKDSGWLAATFQDPLPADMKARTDELQALLGALAETHRPNMKGQATGIATSGAGL